MLHILLLLLHSFIYIPSIYSMEHDAEKQIEKPQKSKHKYLPIPDFNTLLPTHGHHSSQKSPHNNTNTNTVPIITTSSEHITNDIEQSPKELAPKSTKFSEAMQYSKPGLSRSKTFEPSGSPKHSMTKIFSASDSTTEITPKTSPRGRKKSLSTSSRIIKISPRGKSKSKSPREKIPLITAIRDGNLEAIQDLINNADINLNEQDQWKNTPLHRAVLLFRNSDVKKETVKEIINILLLDYRLDSSITNENNHTAQQLLEGGEDTETRQKLFARTTLDIISNKHLKNLLYEETEPYINDDLIIKLADNIQSDIETIESSQGEKLPNEALLPSYAKKDKNNKEDNKFILNMLKHRIPEERITLEKLVSQEASIVLLNGYVNDLMITQAAVAIQKEISEKKLFEKTTITPPTNEFIFKMIKSFIEQKKQDTQNILIHMLPQEAEPHMIIESKNKI